MKSDKVRIGLWGVGRHAQRRLLPSFVGCKNAVISSVHTRDSKIGGQISTQYGCTYRASLSDFLADPKIDAVIICTPTGLHQTHGLQALASGKHVLIEKPFTHSKETTVELYAMARQNRLISMDGLMYLFHPQFSRLKEVVCSGSLGSIRSMSLRFGMPGIIENTFRSQKKLGGGASLDMLCYPLSLAYRLCPTPPILIDSEIIKANNSDVDIGGWCILRSGDLLIDAHWGMELAYRNELSVWGTKQFLHCPSVFTKDSNHISEIQLNDAFGSTKEILKAGSSDAYSLMIDRFALDIQMDHHDIGAEKVSIWCAEMTAAIMD